MPFALPHSPRSISFAEDDLEPDIEDADTLEIPAMRAPEFREEETTLFEVLRPRRSPHRGRMPPKPYPTTEFALPSVIVQAEPSTPTLLLPTRPRFTAQRTYDRGLDTSPVLGPRTSGVLLGALAVAFGVVMLKVIPLLGPLFEAMTR